MTVLESAPVVPATPGGRHPRCQTPVVRPLDLVAIVALTGLTLLGWWSTFDGQLWLFVGVAGAVIGVAVVVHAARRGMLWLVVTLPLAYVGTVIPITGLAFGDAGLPSPATLTQVFAGTFRCWGILVGTHPPIRVRAWCCWRRTSPRSSLPSSPRCWLSTRATRSGRCCPSSACWPASW